MTTPTLSARHADALDSRTEHDGPDHGFRPLPPGARLGRYRVCSLLGRGGMGAVYLGLDPLLEREVALKVAHGDDPSGEAASRMAREAQMLARVSHPNVVAVFDVGHEACGVFVAMERVVGSSLDAWLRAGPRPPAQVLEVFEQAGRGLAALHRAGLVHRDFKPANVVVGDDGRVRVLDLGLAVGAGSRSAPSTGEGLDLTRFTSTGTAVGTPAYMAPEQHLGGEIDPSADQFAFCLALYEALVGRRPFDGPTARDLVKQKLREQCRPIRGRVSRRTRRAVMRGLRAERDHRWPAMEPLLGALSA